MANADSRLAQIRPKIERADQHIVCLQREISTFLRTNPYEVSTKRDPQSRKLIYYVASVEPVPVNIALITGDVIQCLASALDHLAYQLVCADTGDAPPNPESIYFLIRWSLEEYETKKRGKLKGAHEETFKAIDALKPYRGGNDPLWFLYRLNNIEKHRVLITVGSAFRSVDLGAYMSTLMQKAWDSNPNVPFHGKTVPVLSAFFKPADKLFPLKVGDDLFIDAADAEVNEKMQFRFDVALSEPGIIGAQSILELMTQFRGLVEGIITALTPRLG